MNVPETDAFQLPDRLELFPDHKERATAVWREWRALLRAFWIRHLRDDMSAVITVVICSSLVTVLVLKAGDGVTNWQSENRNRPRVLTAADRQEALFSQLYGRVDAYLANDERVSSEMLVLAKMNALVTARSMEVERSVDVEREERAPVINRSTAAPSEDEVSFATMFDRIEAYLKRDEAREMHLIQY